MTEQEYVNYLMAIDTLKRDNDKPLAKPYRDVDKVNLAELKAWRFVDDAE